MNQVDTKRTARIADIMPNPCLIVKVSFKIYFGLKAHLPCRAAFSEMPGSKFFTISEEVHGPENRKRIFSKFLILPPLISTPSAVSILIFLCMEIPDVFP
jgi:hypothetical protein